jgi:hypothetical protein
MASLSALLILAVQALSRHVHPAATIQPRSKPARVFLLGAQRAASALPRSVRTLVSTTRSEARVGAPQGCGFPDGSGIEEERAGGGLGPTVGGPGQDRARIRADDVYPECWQSAH